LIFKKVKNKKIPHPNPPTGQIPHTDSWMRTSFNGIVAMARGRWRSAEDMHIVTTVVRHS
jgi:hypothetical protein